VTNRTGLFAAAAGTTNQKTSARQTATGTNAITETTIWDFVSPVRLHWPEPVGCDHCVMTCRVCRKVSMTDCPVPVRDDCAEETGRDAQPAVCRTAGISFVLPIKLMILVAAFVISNATIAQQTPEIDENTVVDAEADTVAMPRCAATSQLGPEMLVLPGGKFKMGSPKGESGRDEDESPQRDVHIAPFAIAVCEVTWQEYRVFVESTANSSESSEETSGCLHNSESGADDWEFRDNFDWRNALHGSQTVSHPVVCVSWDDANAYADWLAQITGVGYRLPTEAEWEYAARAGTTQDRYYNDSEQCRFVNGLDSTAVVKYVDLVSVDCKDGFIHTAPVGSFIPNDWGLHDMLGNVWEWTQDCWHGSYEGAPESGEAWLDSNSGDCDLRVVRGGGWFNIPGLLRSASRSWSLRDVRGDDLGFRLARTLSPSEF